MHWATLEERRKLGQARRKQVRRQDHGELNTKLRPCAAVTLLQRSVRGGLPALVKFKFQVMAESPFSFFRGAVPVMAADLAMLPSTGLQTQLCGDAHVRNLGAFAASDGRLVFDINDFDETIQGPFEWDLKRLATSLMLAGRAAGHTDPAAREAVELCIRRYSSQMRAFSEMSMVEVSRFQVRVDTTRPVHQALSKAERSTTAHLMEKLTEPGGTHSDGSRRFREQKPLLVRLTRAQAARALSGLGPYRNMLEPQRQHLLSLYRPIDVAFKAVGTGSLGQRDYCIYLEGNGPGDPLFLQMKEERQSAYSAYLPASHPAGGNGQRVVEGQRAMQVQSDPFLGWTRWEGRDFLVRQLNDHKGAIELEDLAGSSLNSFAEVCGQLLARGHARSGDPLMLAGYLGSGAAFAESLAEFAFRYADQTEKDWQELRKTLKVGSRKNGLRAKPRSTAARSSR